jgi:hypothetical protein
MKSKLSAVLVAAGCVLAVSPAIALSVSYNPGATTSSVPGAVLFDDFENLRTGSERPRGVIRRLDPQVLAYFGQGHPWWWYCPPRMLRSSPGQSSASGVELKTGCRTNV